MYMRSVVAIAVVTLNATTPPSSSSHASSVSTVTVSTLVSSPSIGVVIGVYIICSSILRRLVIPALVWWSIGVVIKIGSPVIVIIIVILVAIIITVVIITRVIWPIIIVIVINVIIILVCLAIIIKITSRISRVVIIINVRIAAHGIKMVISSTTPTVISLVLLIFEQR